MLEKLATKNVEDVAELFSLADKCARAAEGRAWHSRPASGGGHPGEAASGGTTPGAGAGNQKKKNKKKAGGQNKPLSGAPTAIAVAPSGGRGPRADKRPRPPSGKEEGGKWCPVHQSNRHSAEECREIKKLSDQVCERQKQRDVSPPPRQRDGK